MNNYEQEKTSWNKKGQEKIRINKGIRMKKKKTKIYKKKKKKKKETRKKKKKKKRRDKKGQEWTRMQLDIKI